MKLLSFHIQSEFRNLKGIKLQFDERNDTYVIIGNNGTGKTNIIEALSSVFGVLYGTLKNFEFSFRLHYKIQEDSYCIKYDTETGETLYKKNHIEVAKTDLILPNRLICNYSGEDLRLWENYYQEASKTYRDSIKTNSSYHSLQMVYIDRSTWKYILLCMLCTRDTNHAFDSFLKEKLHIEQLNSISIEFDDRELGRWQENAVTTYIAQVKARLGNRNHQTTRIDDLNPTEDEPRDLFYKLMGAHQAIKALSIIYNNGVESSYLSEGEKKMMVVLFILEALADEETLVLMDEPDSHIHISRKTELKDMFTNMVNRENIITSHSPTLTNCFDKDTIVMLDRKTDGKIEIIDKAKIDLVNHLTEGKWSSFQQNIFLSSNKDILLVEGPTDVSYIQAALKCFHKNNEYTELDFEYIPCGGAAAIPDFFVKFIPKEGQIVFAFFDADDAGEKGMTKIIPYQKQKPNDDRKRWDANTFKPRRKGYVWLAFYPKPQRKRIRKFNIEDYFSRNVLTKYVLSFNSLDALQTKDTLKNKLAKDCDEGHLKESAFKNFQTLFDLIRKIKEEYAQNPQITEIQ